MRVMKTLVLIVGLMFAGITFVVKCSEDEDTEGDFVPTSEWQEVKPGQAIPAGLHVRLDLEKGGRWAKLMDDQEKEVKSVVALEATKEESNPASEEKLSRFKVDELKAALKKMKSEKMDETAKAEMQEIKDKFRSMEEIRAAFEELALTQETDFEVMSRLLENFKSPTTSVQGKLLALQDLENYVHQVDNAVDFAKVGGITTMIHALNDTDPDIRLEAAHVIGSAVQSNPAVQVKAVEAGALRSIVHVMGDERQPASVRKKALYAISCLIRNFPAAQYLFKNAGGFWTLRKCFNQHGTHQLQLKALSLINDLVVERKETFSSEADEDSERIRQYKLFSLPSVIEEMDLCDDVSGMLLSTEQHDQREVLLTAMKNFHGVCKRNGPYVVNARDALRMYKIYYHHLVYEEERQGDSDSFYHQMRESVEYLLNLLEGEDTAANHIEL